MASSRPACPPNGTTSPGGLSCVLSEMNITCGCGSTIPGGDFKDLGQVPMMEYDELILEAKDMWEKQVIWLGQVMIEGDLNAYSHAFK